MVNPFKAARGEKKKTEEHNAEEPGRRRRFLAPFQRRPKTPTTPTEDTEKLIRTPGETPEPYTPIAESHTPDNELVTPDARSQNTDTVVRRNLFPDEPLTRAATTRSVEVTADGQYISSNESFVSDTAIERELSSHIASPTTVLFNKSQRTTDPKPTDTSQDTIDLSGQTDEYWTKSQDAVKIAPFDQAEEDHISAIEPAASQESSFQRPDSRIESVATAGTSMRSKTNDSLEDPVINNDSMRASSSEQDSNVDSTQEKVAKRVLGAFCADDDVLGTSQRVAHNVQETMREISTSQNTVKRLINLFYDNTCSTQDVVEKQRPYYDETFTLRFIHRMTTNGAALLYLQAPETPGNATSDWKGKTVAMLLEKGSPSPNERDFVQPRLSWTTVIGGRSLDAVTTWIDLLDIISIQSSSQGDLNTDTDLDDLCLFTITTSNGEVYMFESNSEEERDSIVNGLRNVISRLSFQVIVGDLSALDELYHNDDVTSFRTETSGNLPALRNPLQAMNRVAHVILDE